MNNLFAGDEYINIGETGNNEDVILNVLIDEIIEILIDINRYTIQTGR